MGKAKKSALKNLPNSWRLQMFVQAAKSENRKSRPQLLPALAVLWLTGCRPAELEKGVRISCQEGQLTLEVQGAKTVDACKRERGQPHRTYNFALGPEAESVNPCLTLLRLLHAREIGRGASEFVVSHDRDYLYNSVVQLGRMAFPGMRTRVSPYVFRHQIASDLKNDRSMPLEEMAAFMGHLSDYSVGKYGHPSYGKSRGGDGCLPKVQIVVSREVKHSPKVDRLARFKMASAKRRSQKDPKLS
ncbi:hypothetical protein [Burkholderia stabilis]|uniref:hypothetical protein n=1 Tax=Burkholderia stabilis TaxID=95485 RepID=UPI0009F5A3A0|nr:hypothetical protein [Burkholderia stabilis]